MESTFIGLLVLLSSVTCISQTSFKVIKGFKLSLWTPPGTLLGATLVRVNSKCNSATLCSILCSSGCGSATFSAKYKMCITFVEKYYDSKIIWTKDPDWKVLYRNEPVQYGDWTMIFRAQKEINIPLYDVWTATGRHDDGPLSSGVLNECYRLDNQSGCKQHFRSSILDNWINIKQVKLSVYVNGSEVNFIIFNGTSTTRDTWFQRTNILNSSWFSIKRDSNIYDFTIKGFNDSSSQRRFVICGQYGSCASDEMYFLAVDQAMDGCATSWQITVTNFPVFMYSKITGMARPGYTPREFMFADMMVVFVKS